MKKEIYKKEFEGEKINNVVVSDEAVLFKLESGGMLKISTEHSQDCCERVYGDFVSARSAFEELKGNYIYQFVAKSVEDMGVLFYIGSSKIFVPCYNEQNGYYSSDLVLVIKNGAEKTEIDISDSVEDDID